MAPVELLRQHRVAAWVIASVLARSALASAAPAPASSCPALFGYRANHEDNRARRKALLYWVHQDDEATIVAHGSDRWKRPVGVEFEGLSVLATSAARKARWVDVDVAPALAERVACAPGRYRLGVDDSIGDAHVLAVFASGVLVEMDGSLRYLVGPEHRRARWLMAWGSKYKVHVPRAGGAKAPARPAPPRAKPKPPAPRRKK